VVVEFSGAAAVVRQIIMRAQVVQGVTEAAVLQAVAIRQQAQQEL